MKLISLLMAVLILSCTGCSKNMEDDESKIRTVDIELTKQNDLDQWKLSMVPKVNTVGQQGYDIEFQYIGEAQVKDVTVYYRI